jgi:tripeptidyl-peptidase-1
MSTPHHPKYGKHFQSHQEMKRMLLPSDEAIDAVVDWLQSAGVTDIELDADWINFHTTVGIANKLLDTQFHWYVGTEERVHRLRTLEYSVPDSLAEHVYMIQPTTRFGHIRPAHKNSRIKELPGDAHRAIMSARFGATSNGTTPNGTSTDICKMLITPTCLKTLYNINGYTANPHSGSKVGFSSYLQEYSRYADLASFETTLAPWAQGQNFSVVQFNGGLNDQTSTNDSSEANLDLQYILGLSAPLPVTEYSTGGLGLLVPDINEPTAADNQNEPYLDFLNGILKLDQNDLPQVISTSYGEDEQTIPERYARRVCNLYAQLGSRGVSVLFSSGDSGVGTGCVSNDGQNQTRFLPQFPASCPWVTSVGATQGMQEQAASFSSGGFSNLWPRPSYQDAAVQSYLQKLGNQWEGLYNPNGRGFPDVSANGVNYAIYDKGTLGEVEGTSAASPTFAAIVALLNDARLRAGLPVLGFLNPMIYSQGYKALNDITTGGSIGCNGQARFGGGQIGGAVVAGASWNASQGWDPVSGYGTPDFTKLLKLAVPPKRR